MRGKLFATRAVLQRRVQEMLWAVWLLPLLTSVRQRHGSPGVRWADPGASDLRKALLDQLELVGMPWSRLACPPQLPNAPMNITAASRLLPDPSRTTATATHPPAPTMRLMRLQPQLSYVLGTTKRKRRATLSPLA